MLRTAKALGSIVVILSLFACGTKPGGNEGAPGPAPNAATPAALAEVDSAPCPAGVDASTWQALKSALREVLLKADRAASLAPGSDASQAKLELDGDSGILSWYFFSQGDYDQNGEVNISDLTPLALYFGDSSGGGAFPTDSIESVVDGDGNGEINIADVTAIGVNFQCAVAAYEVFSSSSIDDVPTSNNGANGPGATLVGSIGIGSALGVRADERLWFEHPLGSVTPGAYYWVRPTDGALHGTPSTFTVPEGDTLTPGGGAIALDGLILRAESESVLSDVQFTVSPVAAPPGLPSGVLTAGQALDISVSDPAVFDAPVVITMPYDDTGIDEDMLCVLHYDAVEGYQFASVWSAHGCKYSHL